MVTRRNTAAAKEKHAAKAPRKPARRWSQKVNENSDAMDVQHDIFKQPNPRTIAQSLKRSAEKSKRRKSEPFRSAMSMLNFYINRAGRNLPKKQLTVLERAKTELRIAFHRPSAGR
ncbi:MAG: hypothetical protein JWQ11_682 [Rhizobacter sp.]|nr:hypothetical protein [Rhizobacter sp.]